MPLFIHYPLLKARCRPSGKGITRLVVLLLLMTFSLKGYGQEELNYDEVPVSFSVARIGNTEIGALIKNADVWVSVKDIFDFLRIKNSISPGLDSLSGFFIEPKETYLIDKINGIIKFHGKVTSLLPSDLIKTETGLYLRSTVFCQVFGLNCKFNYRQLSFILRPDVDLPAYSELRQEQMRKNISRLKGEKLADTSLKISLRPLHLGTADWSINAMKAMDHVHYLSANLTLGGMIAGGEANFGMNYRNYQSFQLSQQYYRWRFVNNRFSFIRQITVGRIAPQATSSLFGPVNGIQITNTPSTYRKSFGNYRYTGTTQPLWTVELYVNNVLVDYVKADPSGLFAFDIPLFYGNSAIVLKFYGPWGEKNSREEYISIPFNFLPSNQLEYSVSAGIVEDGTRGLFSRASINYGLSRRITLGAGTEYLSSVMNGHHMPYVMASMRLGNRIILNSEYTQGVRLKSTLNYRSSSGIQFDAGYIKYDKTQTASRYNYLEERKASLLLPISRNGFKLLSRISYNDYILPMFRFRNAEFLLSTAVNGISSNLKTYIQYSSRSKPIVYTNLSISLSLPYEVRFSSQLQYQYDLKGFNFIKANLDKKISSKGYLNLAYEHNRDLHIHSFTMALRFDLSFMRSSLSVRKGNNISMGTFSANGSFIYEAKPKIAKVDNQTGLNKGGFIVAPFLDINCNNRRDAGEPGVRGLKLRISRGSAEQIGDSLILITGLEAYTNILIELDKSSFDNIAWQIKNSTISAIVQPNCLRLVEVPVAVVGEASGMVLLQKGKMEKGLSRMLVKIYDSLSNLVASTLTEGDGYFSYLGLGPGQYTCHLDTAQLHLLRLTASPDSISFAIGHSEKGVIADGFEFIVLPVPGESNPEVLGSDPALLVRRNADGMAIKKEQEGVGSRNEEGKAVKPGSRTSHPGQVKENIKQLDSKGSRKPDSLNMKFSRVQKSSKNQTNGTKRSTARDQAQRKNIPDSARQVKAGVKNKPAGSRQNKQNGKLASERNKLIKRNKQVSDKLDQLLSEQKKLIKQRAELIRKHEALLKEIRRLKKQLALKKGK